MREITVDQVMTRAVATAVRDTSIREIVAILTARPGEAVAVIDPAAHPIGMVADVDVLAKLEFHAGADPMPLLAGAAARARWRKSPATTAGELMTAPVACIRPEAGLTAAVRALASAPGLCVVDRTDRLIGTVSRKAVLQLFQRDDCELKADIERQVVGGNRAAEDISVHVVDGIVTLDGVLYLRSTVEHACWCARRVPGVIAVDNHLRFQIDDLMITGL